MSEQQTTTRPQNSPRGDSPAPQATQAMSAVGAADSDDVFADLASIFTRGELQLEAARRGLDMKDKLMVEVFANSMRLQFKVLQVEMEGRVARTKR